MTTTTNREATIEAHPTLPVITITRDFDAAPDRVFRAHTDADLIARWLGPKETEMRIDRWDAETGGSYRYAALMDCAEIATFYGSFHEVRPSERIVWTFTWEGMPDGVALETLTFEDIGEGRTRLTPPWWSTRSRRATRSCPAAWRSASTRATKSSTPSSPFVDRACRDPRISSKLNHRRLSQCQWVSHMRSFHCWLVSNPLVQIG